MPALPSRPASFRHRLGLILRRQDGLAVVEFALLAPLFLMMIFMIFELALLLVSQSALDIATRNAARLIETGQVQQAGNSSTMFRSALCTVFASGLLDCSNLVWSVESASSFATLNASFNTTTTVTSSSFSPGGAGDCVLVRVYYDQTLVLPLISTLLSSTGTSRLASVIAFQNEAYE